jgi:hypothetical protein
LPQGIKKVMQTWRVLALSNEGLRPWLMPVILANWEFEIRRIVVGGQPRQIILETLFPK